MKRHMSWVLLLGVLLTSLAAKADLTVIILERQGMGGRIFGTGHSAIHFSHICTDGSPVKLRMCNEGEGGVVIQRYNNISPEGYDWIAIPADYFFYGVDRGSKIPLFANQKVHELLSAKAFSELSLETAIKRMPDGSLPEGRWQLFLGQAFHRTSFLFTLKDTYEDEQKIVRSFYTNPNKQHFNALWANCSDLPLSVLRIVFSETRRGMAGVGVSTPKALAKGSVDLAKKHNPEGIVIIDKLNQVPGSFGRSKDNLYPLENAFRNPYYAVPVAVFAPVLFVGSVVFHSVFLPFSIPREYKKYATDELSLLGVRETALKEEKRDATKERKNAINAELKSIKQARDVERTRFFGSDKMWEQYKREFEVLTANIADRLVVPAEVKQIFQKDRDRGQLSKALYKLFMNQGSYTFDENGYAVMRLTLTDDRIRQVGITRLNVMEGDDLSSLLIMMATVDYNLSVNWRQRDSAEGFAQNWEMLQAAACRLGVCY